MNTSPEIETQPPSQEAHARHREPYRIVVLISGAGSILKAILDAANSDATGAGASSGTTKAGASPVQVVAVGADRDAPGLTYAEESGVPTFITPYKNFADRTAWGEAMLQEIAAHKPDLVVLAGLMRILPQNMVHQLSPNLINTHPSLLPKYPGAHAVKDALDDGATVTGVSIFIVDEGVDTGHVLVQESVDVLPDDTVETLHERIKVVERVQMVNLLQNLATGQRTLDSGE